MFNHSYLYIIAGASLWGLIGLFVKVLALQGFSSMQIVALRSISSAIFITLLLLKTKPSSLKITFKDSWMFIGTGIFSLTFFNFCYFKCIASSSLAVAVLLLYTAPVFVMLLSLILFKEKFSLAKAGALVTTFIGCGLVTGALSGNFNLSFSGILYGLGSGIGYALYSIFGKFALRKYDSYTITAYTFYFAMISSIPLADIPSMPSLSNISALANILGLSLISTILPYILYTKGLNNVEAGKASVIATIEPFVATTVGILIFNEPLTFSKICGMLLIFTSIILLNLKIPSKGT